MIEFGGKTYYIDFNAIDKLIGDEKALKAQKITDVEETEVFDATNTLINKQITTTKYNKGKEIDLSKYDILKMMLEAVFDDEDINGDTALGVDRILDKAPLSYKLAFNTLLKYGILKEEVEE